MTLKWIGIPAGRFLQVLAAATPLLCMTPAAQAQWVGLHDSTVPRTRNGKLDVQAPAPRAPGGRPDLSGIWEPEKNRPCGPEGCPDLPTGEEFFDIGWGLHGLPYQPWARDFVAKTRATLSHDDPHTRCLPIGLVRLHTMPLLKKIVQSPGLLLILNERNTEVRQIFTDGRPLPDDPQPSWLGYSSGKWEGDALVVQTAGFHDGTWLDRYGSPMSSEARITERFRRPSFGHLVIDLTVDDPKTYTKPWTVRLNQTLVPDTDLLDYICLENEKSYEHLQ